jgi:hypothetical protein
MGATLRAASHASSIIGQPLSAMLLFYVVATTAAQETAGLILTLGRLTTNTAGAKQVLSLENKTSRKFSRV